MSPDLSEAPPRVLGTVSGSEPGPLLIAIGGLHGNEPDGVHAARLVLEALGAHRALRRGRFVALCGNRAALLRGLRYVDRDLNRMWTDAALSGRDGAVTPAESREAAELLAILDELLGEGFPEVCLVDLHSTSAGGAPFVVVADTIQNRRLALAFQVPVLLGLEERVEGTLLSWFSERGHVSICLEGGENRHESTRSHHEAALWVALVTLGMVAPEDVPAPTPEEAAAGLLPPRERLRAAARGLPRVIEVSYREGIAPGESFTMRPGHRNFERVHGGQELAETRIGRSVQAVAAPFTGWLLMPRYQGQGDDGFFLGREVHPFWLRISALVRRLRLGGILRALPGVRRDPARPHELLADPRVARFHLIDLFHLFGYRRARPRGGLEVFVRRPDRFDRVRRRARDGAAGSSSPPAAG